jgi:hypothetical protein
MPDSWKLQRWHTITLFCIWLQLNDPAEWKQAENSILILRRYCLYNSRQVIAIMPLFRGTGYPASGFDQHNISQQLNIRNAQPYLQQVKQLLPLKKTGF